MQIVNNLQSFGHGETEIHYGVYKMPMGGCLPGDIEKTEIIHI